MFHGFGHSAAMKALLLTLFACLSAFSTGVLSGALLAEEGATELPVFEAKETEDLIKKEGQKVVVVGKCDRTGKSRGGTNFVNFADSEFTLVTFKSDLGPFEKGEPADIYKDKFLKVTGVIEIYKDLPQIKLTDPAQIEAADEAFAGPDPEAKKADLAAAEAAAEAKKKAAMSADKAVDEVDAAKATEDGKPVPPVDPRKYFKKPTQ